jgi:hypothetical protein
MSENMKTEINVIKKSREYYNNFINKNKDKLNETKQCEICFGRYKYMNKSHHNKTALHKRVLEHHQNKIQ